VGPICRNVTDAARILDVIAGYDPKDELTAFSIGKASKQPYATFAHEKRLDGIRIGVVREYMNKQLFTKADEQTIDLVSRGVEDLKKLGATVVDPGPTGDLFTQCFKKYISQSDNKLFTKKFPQEFPVDSQGKAATDHITKLIDMKMNPALVPDNVTLRDFSAADAEGQTRYSIDMYLRQRGDANIKSNADLVAKSNFHEDPNFPDRKKARENIEKQKELNMAERMLRRFSVQQMVLQCMGEQKLDALVYPTSNLPPSKLGAPGGPSVNGRSGLGPWSFLGQQGFPVITVPAGFTTEVYDLVRDPTAPETSETELGGGGGGRTVGDNHTRLTGPVAAKLPVGMDIVGRPFDEPLIIKIASAYTSASKHRTPPKDFGPVAGEP
jgi:Asp-tRNA(Asn)/Glu-tRNA(Gln) amidotransferase A subunit family amidase